MQVLKMRITASMIGDFGDFLYRNSAELKKMFSDYESQEKTENLRDGREVTSRLLTKGNISLRFLPGRIDYTFNYPNPSAAMKEATGPVQNFYKILGDRFPDVSAARIAVVMQSFIKNDNCVAISYLTKKFGLTSVFGDSNELHLKINNPISSFEKLNSVLNIDMGEAKNNKTQEVSKVLLVSADVNTLAENNESRFPAKKSAKQFETLIDLAIQKTNNLEKL